MGLGVWPLGSAFPGKIEQIVMARWSLAAVIVRILHL